MGSRERLADVLRELAEGWAHLGNEGQAVTALRALDQIKVDGVTVVEVGHTEYRVEETDVP